MHDFVSGYAVASLTVLRLPRNAETIAQFPYKNLRLLKSGETAATFDKSRSTDTGDGRQWKDTTATIARPERSFLVLSISGPQRQ